MTERSAICWADLGEARGSKPAKRRPVLIIQSDPFNASRLNTTIAAVITSNTALATMPGKEEIFAKLLFLINSPAQRLVTVLNAAGRDLAIVINQGVKESKFAGGEAAAS